jgi:hypothetical protein
MQNYKSFLIFYSDKTNHNKIYDNFILFLKTKEWT